MVCVIPRERFLLTFHPGIIAIIIVTRRNPGKITTHHAGRDAEPKIRAQMGV
jgi:hypothetical protein